MAALVKRKFRNEHLRKYLLSTKDAPLMEWIGSREGYWSVDESGGQNVMGQILTDIRSYIISQSGLAETE